MQKAGFSPNDSTDSGANANRGWSAEYAQRHKLHRVNDFFPGMVAPEKVRIYRRGEHYTLQWWDPAEKRTLNFRVAGDLVAAIAKAREIDDHLQQRRASGIKAQRISHPQLVTMFIDYLRLRADAGEIDVSTAVRYTSAVRYYAEFAAKPKILARYPHANAVDREFQLEFATYLNNLQISPNGHGSSHHRPMKGQAFIHDVIRSIFAWAADPDRGNLLGHSFRNPFANSKKRTTEIAVDPVSEPDINIEMAVELLAACDRFQLKIFAPLILYGLRPSELSWIFRENTNGRWVRVTCIGDLDYFTKGRRDKRFPAIGCVTALWDDNLTTGLLNHHRRLEQCRVSQPSFARSLAKMVEEYQRRCAMAGSIGAVEKRRIRAQLMKDAGQLTYDQIESEFRSLAKQLRWPAVATLKDLRHLFATALENAGVPQFYRQYFMGQSSGFAPIAVYTHLTEEKIQQHYERVLAEELRPVLELLERKVLD